MFLKIITTVIHYGVQKSSLLFSFWVDSIYIVKPLTLINLKLKGKIMSKSKQPDFKYWCKMGVIELWQAIALLGNIEPRNIYYEPITGNIFLGNEPQRKLFYEHLEIAISCFGPQLQGIDKPHLIKVRLIDIVQWAKDKNLEIPEPLSKLADLAASFVTTKTKNKSEIARQNVETRHIPSKTIKKQIREKFFNGWWKSVSEAAKKISLELKRERSHQRLVKGVPCHYAEKTIRNYIYTLENRQSRIKKTNTI
ncbi:MAG: hypothetical protein WCN88_04960 [Candidatus Falkowbacteria bacterium]